MAFCLSKLSRDRVIDGIKTVAATAAAVFATISLGGTSACRASYSRPELGPIHARIEWYPAPGARSGLGGAREQIGILWPEMDDPSVTTFPSGKPGLLQ
jgi:hypothetical protein